MTGKSRKRPDVAEGSRQQEPQKRPHFSKEQIRQMADILPGWYRMCGRVLPWREGRNPYKIWVSEIMLQQTRIEAVRPYYDRFIKELPDIPSLANISEDRLLKLWEGLGYYSRARNLKKAAQVLMEQYKGTMPQDYQALLNLPGIGHYTAGAIASIAFQIPVPAVDGNVLRVLSRVCESREDIQKQAIRREAEDALTAGMPNDPGTFNEALMELGETICLPGHTPLCGTCPLSSVCLGRKNGTAGELPVRAEKKPRRIEEKTILLLVHDGKVGVRKRPEAGLLAGMYEFPALEGKLTVEEVFLRIGREYAIRTEYPPIALGEARHIFTHVEWHMTGYLFMVEEAKGLVFATAENLSDKYALPGAFQFYRKKALQILEGVIQ